MNTDQAVPTLLPQVPKYWQFQSEIVEQFFFYLSEMPRVGEESYRVFQHNISRIQMSVGKAFIGKKWLNEKNQGMNWKSFTDVKELTLCVLVVVKKDFMFGIVELVGHCLLLCCNC